MLNWIVSNIATIIVALLVSAVLVLVLIKLIRDKRIHKPACSCGCKDCPYSSNCPH